MLEQIEIVMNITKIPNLCTYSELVQLETKGNIATTGMGCRTAKTFLSLYMKLVNGRYSSKIRAELYFLPLPSSEF